MNDVFVASRIRIFEELPGLLCSIGLAEEPSGHGLRMSAGGSHVRILPWLQEELEESVPPADAGWLMEGEVAHLLSVGYYDVELCKLAVACIARAYDVWIDNDCGFTGTGAEFLRRLELDPGWDWRAG